PSGLKQPEPKAPPRFVCIGGRAVGSPPRQPCVCAPGQVAKQVAANRYECETQLVCDGGRIVNRGRPPQPSCVCPAGMTAEKVVPPSNAVVRLRSLAAKSGNDPEPDHYRCVRKPSVPQTKPETTSAPKIACAGGVVRANRCYCPRGTALQS